MSIADQITRIKNAKAAIKQAIQNKGVSVSDEAKLDEYPALINSITVGEHINPDFYELRTKGGTDYSSLFYQYAYPSGSYSIDLSHWDTSKVTKTYKMFYYCNSLISVDLSNWDTGELRDMAEMFYYCEKLTELNIGHFNTSKVSSISAMFSNCKKLTQLDLSNWVIDTKKAGLNSFQNLFYECNSLISVNITGWDTSYVALMNSMFYNCNKLVDIIGEIDASGLTNGFYGSRSANPFYKCSSLETLYIKNIYKDISLTDSSKYSINLSETKVKDECLVYIINELPDLINDKGLVKPSAIVLTLPPTNTLTAEQVQPAIDKGWNVANTTY